MSGNEVSVIKQKTDLMSLSVSDTTEATLIRLGCNLCLFKAKINGYNFEEDHSVQFVVYSNQIFKLQN